ncbi:hypothetical protein JL722_15136 [Aureococcus anophagefferens]|nr:hypothetical protein JL722_15136 [Aureococcus anophagefferens]
MASDLATRRLLREFAAMRKAPPDNIVARPLESNVLEWHYVITGTKDSVYEGHYHGKLKFRRSTLRPRACSCARRAGGSRRTAGSA